jgi:hypothetical protein
MPSVLPAAPVPQFISGFCDGHPVYSTVRVYAESVVAQVEEDIRAQDALEQEETKGRESPSLDSSARTLTDF